VAKDTRAARAPWGGHRGDQAAIAATSFYFIARPTGHAADGGITNLPGIVEPFLAGRASVLQLGIHQVRGERWGERLEQFLSWGRQERGSPDRSANGEFRAILLDVAEPGGRLFVAVPWG